MTQANLEVKMLVVYRAYEAYNRSENIACNVLVGCFLDEDTAHKSVERLGIQGDDGRVACSEESCLINHATGDVWIVGDQVLSNEARKEFVRKNALEKLNAEERQALGIDS